MSLRLKNTLDAEYNRGRDDALRELQSWALMRAEAFKKGMNASAPHLRVKRFQEISILDDFVRHCEYLLGKRGHPNDDDTQQF